MKLITKHQLMKLRIFWAKYSQTLLISMIVIFTGGSMVLLAYQGHQINQQGEQNRAYNASQLAAIKDVVDKLQVNSNNRTEQIQTLTDHIDCIATFFAQADRSKVVLENLDQCILRNTQTGAGTGATVQNPKASSGGNNQSPAPTQAPKQPEQAQPTPAATLPPAIETCTINILGIKAFCSTQ